jgi:hypothetical protein
VMTGGAGTGREALAVDRGVDVDAEECDELVTLGVPGKADGRAWAGWLVVAGPGVCDVDDGDTPTSLALLQAPARAITVSTTAVDSRPIPQVGGAQRPPDMAKGPWSA